MVRAHPPWPPRDPDGTARAESAASESRRAAGRPRTAAGSVGRTPSSAASASRSRPLATSALGPRERRLTAAWQRRRVVGGRPARRRLVIGAGRRSSSIRQSDRKRCRRRRRQPTMMTITSEPRERPRPLANRANRPCGSRRPRACAVRAGDGRVAGALLEAIQPVEDRQRLVGRRALTDGGLQQPSRLARLASLERRDAVAAAVPRTRAAARRARCVRVRCRRAPARGCGPETAPASRR